jgi:hypothetical protein
VSDLKAGRQRLQQRIRDKRSDLESFIAKSGPRTSRLTIAGIVATGLAGLLTAGPAAGGPSFTQAVSQAFGMTSPSWRLLCAGATVLSFVATTTLAILKGQDLANRVARAEAASATLEAIDTFLETTDIPVEKAAEQYTQVLLGVAFVPGPAA